MKLTQYFTAALPQLDVHTLSEDWALSASLEQQWMLLADSVGKRPSEWIDTQGDRMYGAVMYLSTWFDLEDTICEDDEVEKTTEIIAIRKPHSLGVTTFYVGGKKKAEVTILTSFIKRQVKGSNKKFSKVRDLWTADDVNDAAINVLLDRHHAVKSTEQAGNIALVTEINRINDFNTADFMYFKNYVRIAKAAEWNFNRPGPEKLNNAREFFFYGNVDDGELLNTTVAETAPGKLQTAHITADNRCIGMSFITSNLVTIAVR